MSPLGPLLRAGRRRQRGLGLADFMAGTLVLSAALLAFSSLTRSKMLVISGSEGRLHALSAAEAELDRVRRDGLGGSPVGPADADGFRLVRAFVPAGPLAEAAGQVTARALRMRAGDPHGLFEARVTVRWREMAGTGSLSISTVAPLPDELRSGGDGAPRGGGQ